MPSTNPTRATMPGHGTSAGDLPTITRDPFLVDALQRSAAVAMQIAGKSQPLVAARVLSAAEASRMRNDGTGALSTVTQIVWHYSKHSTALAYAILAHVKATLKAALMSSDPTDLLDRFDELSDMEHEAECDENRAVERFRRGLISLEDLRAADLRKAAIHEERAGVSLELIRRKLDPRTRRTS